MLNDRRSCCVFVALFAFACLNSSTLGQSVKVQVLGQSAQTFSPGAAISLNLAQANNQINIWTDPISGVNIGRVTITGGPAANGSLFIIVGTGSFQSGDTAPTKVGNHWAGLNTLGMTNSSTVTVNLYGGINGSLTDTLSVYSDSSISRAGGTEWPLTSEPCHLYEDLSGVKRAGVPFIYPSVGC